MDLNFTATELVFRQEVRDFVAAQLPDDIRRKVLGFLRVERDDYVRWQRILHAQRLGGAGLAGGIRRHRLERRRSGTSSRKSAPRRRAAHPAVRPRRWSRR